MGSTLLLGAGGQGQAVDVDILVRDTDGIGSLDDTLCDGKAPLGCGGNTVLVQRQADDGGTVLFAQRQNFIQCALLTVDRVDDRLAVVNTQCAGKGLRIGRIQLQGQVGDGLQILDELFQRGRLVNAGQTGVDIQHFGTGLGLGNRLGAGVGAVPIPQGLLQAFFAGGVDALTYHGDTRDVHKADGGAQAAAAQRDLLCRGERAEGLFQLGNVGGGGAAAAADHRNASGGIFLHLRGKTGGIKVIAAVRVRQACVGLDEHRQPGRDAAAKALRKGQNFGRAERAVDADGIRTQPGSGDSVAFDRAAGKGAAAALKTHRGKHRQAAILLGGKDSGFQLVEVGHCL